jgi:hypothetical protein
MHRARASTKPSVATGMLLLLLLLRYPCHTSSGCSRRRRRRGVLSVSRIRTALLLVLVGTGAVQAWTTRLWANAAFTLGGSKTRNTSSLPKLCVAPAGSAATFLENSISSLPKRHTRRDSIQTRPTTATMSPNWTRPEFISSWRTLVATTVMVAAATCTSSAPVSAAAATTDSADSVGTNTAWSDLRREVLSDTGGVAYLTSCVARADFAALLEYTKTYETKLRKGYLTPAKKQLPKEQQDTATLLINAATFDLIGINRSARPGQESLETATKYVQMLSDDLARFLALEPVPSL